MENKNNVAFHNYVQKTNCGFNNQTNKREKENNFLDLATSGDEIDGENWPESKSNRTAGDDDLDVVLQYHCSTAD